MADDNTTPDSSLALPSGYRLDVRADSERLHIVAPDGRLCLTVALGKDGIQVQIDGAALSIESKGSVSLAADRIDLESRSDIRLRAGGDLSLEAAGTVHTRGFSQLIEATRGDVVVDANDDVRVEGERIRLNAPDLGPIRRTEKDSGPRDDRARDDGDR